MTITGMAKQLNVSTMTIYRRCEKNSIVIGDLRDSSTGHLTSEGVAIIASLFDTTTPQKAITDDATRTQQEYNDVTQTASQVALNDSAAVLQAKLDGANAIIEQLTGERDDLRRQVAALTAALQAEQADRQAERRLLTGGDPVEAAEPRRHWWQRWRR